MRLPPPLIARISRQLVLSLIDREVISSDHLQATMDKVERLITADLSIEDEITDEAKTLLSQHQNELRGKDVEYHRLFTKVKSELASKRGYVLGTTEPGEKIGREKLHDFARKLLKVFLKDEDIEYYVQSEEALRLAIFKGLDKELALDNARREAARQKVLNIKRHIPEESSEFRALSQQFYQELVDRGR
jgi:hypothetical protein